MFVFTHVGVFIFICRCSRLKFKPFVQFHSHGVLIEEARSQSRQNEEQRRREDELNAATRRHTTLKALLKLGLTEKMAFAKECFLGLCGAVNSVSAASFWGRHIELCWSKPCHRVFIQSLRARLSAAGNPWGSSGLFLSWCRPKVV